MGYYEGQYKNPCPRCGGVVATLFVSIGEMGFWQKCGGCGTTDFTDAEREQLGGNELPHAIVMSKAEFDAVTEAL